MNWVQKDSPTKRNGKKRFVRHIYNLKNGNHFVGYVNESAHLGIRPVKYLKQLGILIAEGPAESVAKIEQHPDVEHAEADVRIHLTEPQVKTKTVPLQEVPWGIERIEARRVWRKTSGAGVKVAVVDTGISTQHPAFQTNYRGGVNILSPMFPPEDYNGHGTHVAGIIGGNALDIGVVGVAPNCSLYAVKAFNRKGSANLSDLLTAINWCIENKMNIINMSFGMEKLSEALKQAIQIAYAKGIIMVAATGNKGLKGHVDFPARYEETIAVTSVSPQDIMSSFSNQGNRMDLAAPGEKILSAWLNQSKKEMSGTSMAVPHVSGTIALMLSISSKLSPEEIRSILQRTSQKMEGLSRIGVVNAYQAIRYLETTKSKSNFR